MHHSIETRQIVVNNQLINYYFSQPAEKPSGVVVFLHGWRSEGAVWLPLMERLADFGIASYGIDLPGFGRSQTPKSAWRISDYAHAVASLAAKLELKHVALVGHSFGGRVGIKLAALNPDWMEKLILADSAGIRDEPRMSALKFIVAKIFKPFFAPVFMQPLRRKIYSLIGAEDYVATTRLKETFLNIINEDLAPLLPNVACETLLVWGDEDKITPLASAELMQKNIPRSRLVVLRGAGHFAFLDKPDEFFEAVKNFIIPTAPSAKKYVQ